MKCKYIVSAISAITCVLLLIIITTSRDAQWKGIAVSQKGQVYLGTSKTINLLTEKHTLQPLIDVTPFRGYQFTIKDDKIIIAKSKKHYEYSLSGNFIQENASGEELFRDLNYAIYAPIDRQETRYQMKSILGYHFITKTDLANNDVDIIYQMSVSYYLLCILLIISFLVLGGCVIIVISSKISLT